MSSLFYLNWIFDQFDILSIKLMVKKQYQVESELTELPMEERTEYLKSLGVNESGLGNLIRATYKILGLRTYFTSGEKVKHLNLSWYLIIFLSIFLVKPS